MEKLAGTPIPFQTYDLCSKTRTALPQAGVAEMLYRLIAARDGNILHDLDELDNARQAEAWAFRRIAETFDLVPDEYFDFFELCGDTDGVRLELA